MIVQDLEWRKEMEKEQWERDVLKCLLYVASQEGRQRLPTEKVLILSGLIKGTVDYFDIGVTPEVFEVVSPHPFDEVVRIYPPRKLTLQFLYQWSSIIAEDQNKTLQPRIRTVIDGLTECSPEKPQAKLYDYLRPFGGGGIFPNSYGETFSLESTLCYQARHLFSELAQSESREITEIGRLMEKHLWKDAEYWRDHNSIPII